MKKLFIILTVLLVLGTSCEEFLSVDEKNPNSASAVPANLILPAALNATANFINQPDNYSFVYLWYGWWSVSGGYSQSPTLTQYRPTNSNWQGMWSNSYLNLQNYDYIDKTSKGAANKPYRAVAKIMKAYIFQYLVDTYGNIPYTEALQTEKNILKPKYDDAQTVYEKLVVDLDSAMNLIDTAPADAAEIGDYDIVYHGDMDLWWKFANTLKLRLLINQTAMSGRTSYITTALGTTAHTVSNYLGSGEGAWVNPGFLKSAEKMNPFWENFYKQDGSLQSGGLDYYVAGQDMCDFLTANNDPRKFRFFTESSDGSGIIQGNYFGENVLRLPSVTSDLGPGILQAYNQDAPLMTDWEALFLVAEAVQRGLVTGATAKSLYEAAVTESIVYLGGLDGTAAGAATYLAQSGKPDVSFDAATDKIKLILTQKWCALNGFSPMPSWTDYRRTGFPTFIHFTQDAAKANATPPVRLLYPQTELNVNGGNVPSGIDLFTSKIFWDAN